MRGLLARASLALLLGASTVAACSGDEGTGSAAPPGNNTGSSGAYDGGSDGIGASATGGKSSMTNGGAPSEGGARSEAGMSASSGAPAGGGSEVAGAGNGADLGTAGVGGGGASEPEPGPPDLITATGGPWPDSFTGTCINATKVTTCPQEADPLFGQDGTYRLNVPTYKTTSTTLTDSVTGLVWQRLPEQAGKTQAEAVAYCDALSLAGQNDWRLPTRLEAVSILDEGRITSGCMPPAVPQESLGTKWTASPTGTSASQYFSMNEEYGAWTVAVADSKFAARCVRGTPPAGVRSVDTDVTTDAMTKLVWQTTMLDATLVNWQDALAYCEGLSHAGKDDWRLPNIKELATLVDESATAAPVLYADLGGTATQYWSSTPAPTFGSERFSYALEVTFGSSPSLKTSDSAAAARCVRSAD